MSYGSPHLGFPFPRHLDSTPPSPHIPKYPTSPPSPPPPPKMMFLRNRARGLCMLYDGRRDGDGKGLYVLSSLPRPSRSEIRTSHLLFPEVHYIPSLVAFLPLAPSLSFPPPTQR